MTQESINASKAIYNYLRGFIILLNVMIFVPGLFYKMGLTTLSKVGYFLMGFFCHQMPQRSFFMFGNKIMYSKEELLRSMEWGQMFTMDIKQRFTCSEHFGCKFAVCSRCTGIYTGIFTGMLFSGLVLKSKIPRFLLLIILIPMTVDGLIQLLALILNPDHPFYESNNKLRLATGFLFGLGFSLLAFSKLQKEFLDAERHLKEGAL